MSNATRHTIFVKKKKNFDAPISRQYYNNNSNNKQTIEPKNKTSNQLRMRTNWKLYAYIENKHKKWSVSKEKKWNWCTNRESIRVKISNSRFPGVPPIIPDPANCLQFGGNAISCAILSTIFAVCMSARSRTRFTWIWK